MKCGTFERRTKSKKGREKEGKKHPNHRLTVASNRVNVVQARKEEIIKNRLSTLETVNRFRHRKEEKKNMQQKVEKNSTFRFSSSFACLKIKRTLTRDEKRILFCFFFFRSVE